MIKWLDKFVDDFSEFFSSRKGLLPLIGILLIVVNFITQFFIPGWLSTSNFFLHLGLVLAIFGLMLARVL